MGFKAALHAAFGLGAVGGDDLNAKFLHCPGELRERLFIPELFFDSGLAVDLVNGIFINVESHWAAMLKQISFGSP